MEWRAGRASTGMFIIKLSSITCDHDGSSLIMCNFYGELQHAQEHQSTSAQKLQRTLAAGVCGVTD